MTILTKWQSTLPKSHDTTFSMWKLTIQKTISKWPLQGLLSLLRTRKFVRQNTGAWRVLIFCHNSWHSPFKQEIQQRKNHHAIWSTELYYFPIFLFHNWSSFTKIISSFPSLQDDETVLDNTYNWFGKLFFIDTRTEPWTSTRLLLFFYSNNDY